MMIIQSISTVCVMDSDYHILLADMALIAQSL